MTRRERLVAWWSTARSTYQLARWEARWWTLFGVLGVLVRSLRESIPVLFFLSCYALRSGNRAEAQAAKIEMRAEEAEAS